MEFEFTKDMLAELIDADVDIWHGALCGILPEYRIASRVRVAHFMAQTAHESGGYRRLEENLNYSSEALVRVFGRYFGDPPKRDPQEYHRQPEKIANYVYMDEFRANKLGNTEDGDGWLFRGRGLIQLTGRDNYRQFGAHVGGKSAEDTVDYVATPEGAVESACWFWQRNGINEVVDKNWDNADRVTVRVNGGYTGLKDRRERLGRAIEVLGI